MLLNEPDIPTLDLVNHPPHYQSKAVCPRCERPIECIDAIEQFGPLRFSAMKYLWRADEKGATKQDLEKAIWYIQREINNLPKTPANVSQVLAL